jgi:hypothetical protein
MTNFRQRSDPIDCTVASFFFNDLDPGVELGPWRRTVTPRDEHQPLRTPQGVKTLCSLEEWRGEQRLFTPGANFPPWGPKLTPRGQSSPLGANLTVGFN